MKKLVAAFVSGSAAGAVALAIATGLLFGGSANVDVELAAAAPSIPGEPAAAAAVDAPAAPVAVVQVVQAPVDKLSHFGVDPAQSAAKIIAYQTGLLGDSTAVGTGSNVTGEIFLHQSGALGEAPSWFQLDMRTLRSGDSALSSFLRSNLETNKYPAALFTVESVEGIPATYTDGNDFSFRMSGPLTMHGRTRPVTWTVKARQTGDFLSMAADTDFLLTDYGWTPPDYGIARARNNVHLQVTFVAGRIE